MYRTAARRLLPLLHRGGGAYFRSPAASSFRSSFRVIGSATFGASAAENPPKHSSGDFNSDSTSSSSSSKVRVDEERETRPRIKSLWQKEEARLLHASLRHVNRLGWTDAAMIAGAKDIGVSPAIVGSFPRKEAALVEFFMDDCLQRLVDVIDTREDLKNLIPSQHIAQLVRVRLEMQAPYISKWPQALSVQVQPSNVSISLKQRAMLVDEIWHSAGDESSDTDWYLKRTVLGGIYSATELYMLTDTSPDFRDTWAFLDDRVKDAFDLGKTVQEVKYLAKAVEAGTGGSLQGFLKKIFQG